MESIDHQCRHTIAALASAGVAILVTVASAAGPARADTITVTTNNDEFLADGDCALREAIQSANSDTAFDACAAGNGTDTIVLAAEMFGLKLNGAGEDNNLTGDLDITSDIVLQGSGSASTQMFTLAADRLLHVHAGASVEIRDMELLNGTAPQGADDMTMMGMGGPGEHGGAIANSGTLLVADCAFNGNSAGRGGHGDVGGIGGAGGAIWSDGTLTVETSAFTGNTAGTGGNAGPMSMLNGATGGHGGAIYSSGMLTVDRVTMTMNQAGDGGMGAMNGAGGAGGGIYQVGSSILVTGSTLTANTTGSGTATNGGGAIYASTGGTIINTTITGNFAGPDSGGGIAAPGAFGLKVTHSTIVDNTPPGVNGNMGLRGTIVLGNANAGMMNHADCEGGGITSDGYNLTGTGTGCPSMGTGDITTDSGDALSDVLTALADNGGPTETHGLAFGSPALDAGVCTDAMGTTVATDQRGAPRPAGMECDIGAYESAPLPDTTGDVLFDVSPEPAGGNCASGGQRIDVGQDADGNGVLDPGEIETTAYVCNGQPGSPGGNGQEGRAVLVNTVVEDPSENCANGGLRIEAGVDENRDGTLEPAEVDSTTYVCNGENGVDGGNGSTSLINVSSIPEGNAVCPFGGTRIETGIDDNENGELEGNELDDTSVICSADTSSGCSAGGGGASLWFLLLLSVALLSRRRRATGQSGDTVAGHS